MSKNLTISLVQTTQYWENVTANLSHLEEKIASEINQATDLIIFPELFNTGFSMEVSEPMNATTHKWMKQIAAQYNTSLVGSIAIIEQKLKYNRALIVNSKSETLIYNKKHLFALGKENECFTAGTEKLVFSINNWEIQPFICYDLRFPVWCRNTEVDLLIFVASWPKTRILAWKTLLKARAIENQCYVIGVNRIGTDGNQLEYNGQSLIIDYEGNELLNAEEKNEILTFSLDYEKLRKFRLKLPFYKDADQFYLK